MTTPHVLDELSPYIDNECRDPERIARHLQSCPDCARRHLELLRLSAHLRATPGPAVSRDFAARVTALAEARRERGMGFRPMALRLACAACLLLAIGGAAFRWLPVGTAPPGVASPRPMNAAWQDDERVVDEFARLMDAGVTLDVFGDAEEIDADDFWLPLDDEAVLDALAYDLSEVEVLAESPEDLAALLDELAELDAQMLGELLQAYEYEG